MSGLKRNGGGFTLVELLIVVAIIGILTTIGMPTYKRMAQKVKKSEAKVLLGGVYSAEAIFFSEFGAYGNNLLKIGFEVEGAPSYYAVGFPHGGCSNYFQIWPPWDPPSKEIAAQIGDYYNAAIFYSIIQPTAVDDSCFCYRGFLWFTLIDLTLDGKTYPAGYGYRASATGVIGPGIPVDTWDVNLIDNWYIDSERQMWNAHDGVQ